MLTAAWIISDAFAIAHKCDDLGWSDQNTHIPGGVNGTNQTGYSWHIHYLYTDETQVSDMATFQSRFCKSFAEYGQDGEVGYCDWGPNSISVNETIICGSCKPEFEGHPCGSGTCTDDDWGGPWSVCQQEFFVPSTFIDEVSSWIMKQADLNITAMRHPNSGCQWGDHSPFIRAEFFFGPIPEMCLWDLPCNDPGFGCRNGMCGEKSDGHNRQHASGCYVQV